MESNFEVPNRIPDHIYDQKDKDPRKYAEKQIAEAKTQTQPKQEPLPEVLDAGDDVELPPARGWLFGNIFARNFLSSLFGDGGVGKTALRNAQYMSLATGRNLTGEHIFQRCRVLPRSGRAQHAPRGLEGDLPPQSLRRGGKPVFLAKPVMHRWKPCDPDRTRGR